MLIKIEPLTEQNLEKASKLVNEVFSTEEESPSLAFKDSNFSKRHDLRYWVAVNDSDTTLGTVGLYYEENDEDGVYWLGWFCVKSQWRRQGIGTLILEFAINKTKEEGRRVLKLYTSTDPNELASHQLYEKHGFRLVGEGPPTWDGFQTLYYELDLEET